MLERSALAESHRLVAGAPQHEPAFAEVEGDAGELDRLINVVGAEVEPFRPLIFLGIEARAAERRERAEAMTDDLLAALRSQHLDPRGVGIDNAMLLVDDEKAVPRGLECDLTSLDLEAGLRGLGASEAQGDDDARDETRQEWNEEHYFSDRVAGSMRKDATRLSSAPPTPQHPSRPAMRLRVRGACKTARMFEPAPSFTQVSRPRPASE